MRFVRLAAFVLGIVAVGAPRAWGAPADPASRADPVAAEPVPPAGAEDDVGDDPLDEETLALIRALTSTPAAPLFFPPQWTGLGANRYRLTAPRLRETLARDLAEALDELPIRQGSLRGRLGPLRRLDHLRVEPSWLGLGRLDPHLYGSVTVDHSPSAARAARTWVAHGEVQSLALPAPDDGWSGSAAVEARTADRGLGGTLGLAFGGSWASFRANARFDQVDDLRVRTGSVSFERATSAQRWGVSARARFGGQGPSPLWLDLGYDFDGARDEGPQGPRLGDAHLAQATVAFRLESVRGRLSAGWIGVRSAVLERDLLQVSTAWAWEDRDAGASSVELLEPPSVAGVRAQHFAPLPRSTLVEVGGLYASALDEPLSRAEIYAAGQYAFGPLVAQLSGRLSEQQGEALSPNTGVSVDARLDLELFGPLNLWGRYTRSFAFLEISRSGAETVDLLEAGPYLSGPLGWLSAGLWWAQAERLPTQPSPADAALWGFFVDGALQCEGWVLAGAISRATVTQDEDPVAPQPNLQGRLALRALLPEVGGFAELGVRSALEEAGDLPRSVLLPPAAEALPYAVLDFRGAVALGSGLGLLMSVVNALDTAWSPFATGQSASGIDVRLSLRFASSS